MNTITAAQAKKITDDNLAGPAIETFVSALTEKIKTLAKEGKSSFDPWIYLASLHARILSHDEREAIRLHFINAGFTWEDNPDPDPGNPLSRPYTVLSW